MKRKRKRVFRAWAVEYPFDWGRALVGQYWNFAKYPLETAARPLPTHLDGCEIALFKTRTLVRAALRDTFGKKRWPGAREVRVKVTVEIVGK